VRGVRARDSFDLLLHDGHPGEAPEAEHADPEPDDPEAGEQSGGEGGAAQQSRTATVRGDEDRALGLGGDSLLFDDCHQLSLP
jgi:hypothetical protein